MTLEKALEILNSPTPVDPELRKLAKLRAFAYLYGGGK